MKSSKEQTLEMKDFYSKRLWPLTWPHQGAILENNVPFQISNGPQLWLVKLHASLCIDKYHFLDLYGLCNMKKQIVKPQLEKYVDFSLLSLTSLLSAPEREVTSPSDFKVVGALRHLVKETMAPYLITSRGHFRE
jgi:hypothetical protein